MNVITHQWWCLRSFIFFSNNGRSISGGYGDLMDTNDDNNTNNENNQSLELIQPFEYEPVETNKPQQEFSKEIVEYKEPQYLPNTVNHFPLNTTHIDDYSGVTSNNTLIILIIINHMESIKK